MRSTDWNGKVVRETCGQVWLEVSEVEGRPHHMIGPTYILEHSSQHFYHFCP